MDEEIIISIIMITYNHEKYISQAIESILSQSCSYNFEILIGDDCSLDSTCEIVNSYQKKHPHLIKTIRSEQNVGAIRNEKRLLYASRGKYIAFLEGDDYWIDPLKLQKQVDFLEYNPDYGMVHGDVNHYFEGTNKTEYHINKTNNTIVKNGNLFFEILKPNPLFIKTATVCFRKYLMKYFDYDLAIRENWPLTDLPLWLDISYNSKVYYFDDVFATYRLLNESASRTTSPIKKHQYHLALYRIKKHYLAKYHCNDKLKQAIEEEHYRGLIKIAYASNNQKTAQECISYFEKKQLKLSLKEKIMFYSTKYRWINIFIKLFRAMPLLK